MSSAGINFSGLASGIDTKSVIEALLAVERKPLAALQTKRTSYEKQKTLFGDFESKLGKLKTAADALKTAGKFLEFKATPEKEDYFTATASSGATSGSYDIRVLDLAKAKVATSAGQADKGTSTYGSGTLYITVGSTTKQITFDGSETLQDVAARINEVGTSSGAGELVQATVLDTGNGTNRYQLVLTAKTSGLDGAFTLNTTELDTGLKTLFDGFTTSTTASDAHITIDGVDVYRSKNQIDDAIAGVTLNLKAKSPGAVDTKLTITTDTTAVAKKVKDLVDAYNDVVAFVKGQNEQDSKGNAKNPLFGDSTLSTIRGSLRTVVGTTFDTGNPSYSMLAQMGVTSDRDGKLTFDETKFSAAVVKGETAVRSLFSDTTKGIANALSSRIESYTSSVDGIILARKQGFDRLVKNVDDQIAQGERRLGNYELQLKNKFSAMESMLSRLQSQGSALGSIGRR